MKKEIESIDDIFKSIRDAPHGKFLLQLEKSIRQYDKQGSILFAEWIDQNCTKSFKGYFMNELIDGKVENEFTIAELYDIMLSQHL